MKFYFELKESKAFFFFSVYIFKQAFKSFHVKLFKCILEWGIL